MSVVEEYVSNPEYETYYEKLGGLRGRIAADLPVQPAMRVLDVATGSGYFAIEVAELDPSLRVVGVEIADSDVRNFKKNVKRAGLADRVEVRQMDATKMDFRDEEFDMAVNFTGLEDIHMTRGRDGVRAVFFEVARVLRPGAHFCFVVMPPDEMETEAQRIEVELFSWLCGATWLASHEYEEFLREAGFELLEKRVYRTGKKLTPEQAKSEIRYAVKWDPIIYGIQTPPFEEAWAKFGPAIEQHGLGHYSKVVSFEAREQRCATNTT
jgi:ubiquinone/menaquinone biosynthesis C-methylase UbiE